MKPGGVGTCDDTQDCFADYKRIKLLREELLLIATGGVTINT